MGTLPPRAIKGKGKDSNAELTGSLNRRELGPSGEATPGRKGRGKGREEGHSREETLLLYCATRPHVAVNPWNADWRCGGRDRRRASPCVPEGEISQAEISLLVSMQFVRTILITPLAPSPNLVSSRSLRARLTQQPFAQLDPADSEREMPSWRWPHGQGPRPPADVMSEVGGPAA